MKVNQMRSGPFLITRILGSVALFLIFASLGGDLMQFFQGSDNDYVKTLFPLFDLDEEYNVPTYFSVTLMIFAALLLAAIAILAGKRQHSDISKWALLAAGFLCMAYDEVFMVHERLIHPIRAMWGKSSLGIFYYAWVIPGVALVFFLGLFFLKFLLRLPKSTRFTFIAAASLYLGGSIGFEFIGGWYAELNGTAGLTYNAITTLEESLEMAGLIVFIDALLAYLVGNFGEIKFRPLRWSEEKPNFDPGVSV
jgi:hypothetical protein